MNEDEQLPGETTKRCRILVTSFGPFSQYEVNPSTSVLRKAEEILNSLNERTLNVNDVKFIFDFPVCYAQVDKYLPEIVEKYNPRILIHLGVGGQNDVLYFEKGAFCRGYVKTDILGNVPLNNYSADQCPKNVILRPDAELMSVLNCIIAKENLPVKFDFSDSAGRYLCEYIYHKSLSLSNGRSIFIHIPLSIAANESEMIFDQLVELCAQSLVIFLLELVK
uniref:Pyroglutamyl-peptidase I n=1 Tax=Romanomermis culicivorax TaxID=13658 RepID=A0A915IDQ2_ROMCU